MEPDHLEGKGLRPIIGRISEGDGQIDLPEWHGVLSRHDAVETCLGRPNAQSIDAHGVERFCVHDVEATASIHQHLGEVLLVDNGVNDEQVASWSGNMGWMVPLIKSDQRFRPAKEGGDGRFGDARLLVAHFVLVLGVDSIGSPEDHDAFLGVGEAVPILARCASFLGYRLFAVESASSPLVGFG